MVLAKFGQSSMESYQNTSLIRLRPFLKNDFEKLISWVDREETMVQFAGTYFSFPLTGKQLERYLEDKNRLVYKVVLATTKMVIGHAEIFLNYPTATLCRILIGEKRYRGKGIGQEIVNSLLEISFNQLGATRAILNVYDWNINAIRCYEKVGFAIDREKVKSIAVNGQTWTALNMSIGKLTWSVLKQK